MQENGCNRIVFSSSASVYGSPEYLPIDENHPVRPKDHVEHLMELSLELDLEYRRFQWISVEHEPCL